MLDMEFENGTFDGIWSTNGASIVNLSTDDGLTFRGVWNPRGGAVLSFGSFGGRGVPDIDDWFVALWRSGTSPPGPGEMFDLFEEEVPVTGGTPLFLLFDPVKGLQIVVDVAEADRVIVPGGK